MLVADSLFSIEEVGQVLACEQRYSFSSGITCDSTGEITGEITNVAIDSREAAANTLFVPLRGTKTDGHNFIAEAVKLGAN
jgi:UDP-N-acetylmuramyl pentapeptide synthase